MSKYLYPCIITQKADYFIATFPDLNNREFFEKDLYDLLAEASNILLIELTLKEYQREVANNPSDIKSLKLQENQFATYIICDTELLTEELELIDNSIKIEELVTYLQERDRLNKKRKEEDVSYKKDIKKPKKNKENLPSQNIDGADISFVTTDIAEDSKEIKHLVPNRPNKAKVNHNLSQKKYNQ